VLDVLQQMTSPYTAQGAVFYAAGYLVAAWLSCRLVRSGSKLRARIWAGMPYPSARTGCGHKTDANARQ